MYDKYIVYIDDGDGIIGIAIAAACEESARIQCAGNGEIIKVKKVSDRYQIDSAKVRNALSTSGFGKYECDFICRLLTEFGVAE